MVKSSSYETILERTTARGGASREKVSRGDNVFGAAGAGSVPRSTVLFGVGCPGGNKPRTEDLTGKVVEFHNILQNALQG